MPIQETPPYGGERACERCSRARGRLGRHSPNGNQKDSRTHPRRRPAARPDGAPARVPGRHRAGGLPHARRAHPGHRLHGDRGRGRKMALRQPSDRVDPRLYGRGLVLRRDSLVPLPASRGPGTGAHRRAAEPRQRRSPELRVPDDRPRRQRDLVPRPGHDRDLRGRGIRAVPARGDARHHGPEAGGGEGPRQPGAPCRGAAARPDGQLGIRPRHEQGRALGGAVSDLWHRARSLRGDAREWNGARASRRPAARGAHVSGGGEGARSRSNTRCGSSARTETCARSRTTAMSCSTTTGSLSASSARCRTSPSESVQKVRSARPTTSSSRSSTTRRR